MALSLFVVPKYSFQNDTGGPANGWKLYSYEVGSATPKATYADSEGAATNSNPIVLNARGEAVIYLDGLYKFVLTDNADVEKWSADNVGGINVGVQSGYLTKNVAGNSNVTLTASEQAASIIEFTGALTGNITVYVGDDKDGHKWIIKNSTTGSYTLTFSTTSGTGPIVAQGNTSWVYSDATDIIDGTDYTTRPQTVNVSSASAALTVTQTGAGNALVVEDSTSPDSTPTVIDAAGRVAIGGTPAAGRSLTISQPITGATTAWATLSNGTIQSDVTSVVAYYQSLLNTAAAAFSVNVRHFNAAQATIGSGSTVSSQYGYAADSSLVGATNNYGFYGNIAAGTGRYNFYAAGTAANYFAGDMQLDKTITAGGTTGAQTINKNAGSVNFAASATSLVVTDSRVTANSVVMATVATNDATMTSVQAVPAAGSFTLYANAAATAETRVNFAIIN